MSNLFHSQLGPKLDIEKALSIKVEDKEKLPPYDKSTPPEIAFVVHALDFTSAFLYLFPPHAMDKPFRPSWWMYLFWPVIVFFHLVWSLLAKPLGLKPFVVLDR